MKDMGTEEKFAAIEKYCLTSQRTVGVRRATFTWNPSTIFNSLPRAIFIGETIIDFEHEEISCRDAFDKKMHSIYNKRLSSWSDAIEQLFIFVKTLLEAEVRIVAAHEHHKKIDLIVSKIREKIVNGLIIENIENFSDIQKMFLSEKDFEI